MNSPRLPLYLGLLTLTLGSSNGGAAITEIVGSFSSWPSQWNPLTRLTDVSGDYADSALDLVGDAADPLGYWASDANYVFIRFRLAQDTVASASDFEGLSYFAFIDVAGQGADGYPDFAISWDGQQGHGLELNVVTNRSYTEWDRLKLGDFDENSGQKLETDINGGDRTSDGYIRSIDQQGTAAFGHTTYFEIAVSCDYLTGYNTGLSPDQTWSVAFGSLSGANEHQGPGADMAGNTTLAFAIGEGWTEAFAPIPEPASLPLILAFLTLSSIPVRRRRV